MREIKVFVEEHGDGANNCWLCDPGETTMFNTDITMQDTGNGNILILCVEHLDAFVSGALEHHRANLKDKNDRWYETPTDNTELFGTGGRQ